MKKLLSAGVISLTLLAGSTFAFAGQDYDHDRDDHHRRITVVRTDNDRYQHRRHARIFRTGDGRVIILHRRHARVYYDRHHRMP
jgi:hypothetical protein